MKVAIIFGGVSTEYQVSMMSVTSVLKNIDPKYDLYLVGITKDGTWYHFTGTFEEIENDTWFNNPNNEEVLLSTNPADHGFYQKEQKNVQYVDLVYPLILGRGGEDGCIPALCQLAKIPFVSCDMTSCALSMDKEFTHIICEANGIKMAKYVCFKKEFDNDYEAMYQECNEKLGFPCFIKPSKEGSSFGCHKVRTHDEFITGIQDAYKYDRKIIVEELMNGTEVGAGVLGNNVVGEVFEIVVETDMYGYQEKYFGYKTNIYTPAKTLSKQQQDEVKNLSLKINKILDCHVLARMDFFNSSKGLIFNELNTIPGFTSHSLYPASFLATGITYRKLIDNLIETGLKGR